MEDTLVFTQNDSGTFEVAVTDENRDVFPLTSYTAKCDVRRKKSGLDVYSITGVIDTPSSGVIAFPFAKNILNQPGDFIYVVEITDGTHVYSVAEGVFCVIPDGAS